MYGGFSVFIQNGTCVYFDLGRPRMGIEFLAVVLGGRKFKFSCFKGKDFGDMCICFLAVG